MITSVVLDLETLGGTIAEIAQQKAGIFKKGKKAGGSLHGCYSCLSEKAEQLAVDPPFQGYGIEQDRF